MITEHRTIKITDPVTGEPLGYVKYTEYYETLRVGENYHLSGAHWWDMLIWRIRRWLNLHDV